MALNTLTAFDYTRYAGRIVQEYNRVDVIRPEWGLIRDLRDTNQTNIPVIQERTAAEVAPGADRLSGSGTTERSVNLVHNASLEISDKIPFEQQLKLPFNYATQVGRRIVRDLAAAKAVRGISYLASVASSSSPNHQIEGAFLADDSGLAVNFRNALVEGANLFDEQNYPRGEGMRICVAHPNLFNSLFTLSDVVSIDYGGVQGVQTFRVMKYADWYCVSSPAAFNTDLSALGNSNTPTKFKNNLAAGGIGGAGKGGVWAVGFYTESIAQGFATYGDRYMKITNPWYWPGTESWQLNVSMIWDIVALHYNASYSGTQTNKATGVIRFVDDGV